MSHLPLLDRVLVDIPDGFFENTLLIACQHLLPATSILMDCFTNKGLEEKNIFLIGKCYSTSEETYQELIKKNIYVCPSSILFNSHESHYLIFKKHVSDFLKKIFLRVDLSRFNKIIILDDGGELLSQANEMLPEGLNVHGVEQTSFGFHKLKNIKLKYNIINIARSRAKLTFESTLVAKSVCNQLHDYLMLANIKKILIFGNGSIGSAVSKILKVNYEIVRYDLDFEKSDLKKNKLSELSDSDMIIGCSGKNILPDLLKNNLLKSKVFLASASSYDLEFDGLFFRIQKPQTNYCHGTIHTDQGILLNSGFPVNFFGSQKDGISLHHFQLTLALLLAGVAQSNYNPSFPKLLELDYNIENKIINNYLNYTSETTSAIA